MKAPAALRPTPTGIAIVTALALAALSSGSLAAPAIAGAPAPTGGCTWTQHSKRVLNRVRRHGKWRKAKRLKHWWSCEALPSPTAFPIQPALPISPSPEPPSTTEPEPTASNLGVKAVEWSYTLSRPEVTAGEVTIELNNQGEDAHNLRLQREGSAEPPLLVPEAGAGEVTSASFDLPPGTYHLYCSLYQHEERGMHATLVVVGGG